MKKLLLLSAVLSLCATNAFAVGIDISARACAGQVNASQDWGNIDCANSDAVQLYVSWQAGESYPDLVGIDTIIDITVNGRVDGGSPNPSPFWDFAQNSAALAISFARPANPTCTAYTATWGNAGISGAATAVLSPTVERIAASCARATPVTPAPVLNQKLFGLGLLIDSSTSAEAGGAGGAGCSRAAGIVLEQIAPSSQNGLPYVILTNPNTPNGNVVTANGSTLPTPTSRHTWGQLKSLYR